MAVMIVNVSDEYSSVGLQQYELRINHIVKAKFEHRAEDGLSKCLRKAADAFEEERDKLFMELLKERTKSG